MAPYQPKPTEYWVEALNEKKNVPVVSEEEREHVEALTELVRMRQEVKRLSNSWMRNSNTLGFGGDFTAVDIRSRAFELDMVLKGVQLD